MTTVSELKMMALTYIEYRKPLPFHDPQALLWFNQFLRNKLGIDAMLIQSVDFPLSQMRTPYALPEDFRQVHRVDRYAGQEMDDSQYRGVVQGFEVDGEEIRFPMTGHFRVKYLILPPKVKEVMNESPVDELFDTPAALWLAYRFLTYDNEDNVHNQSLGQHRLSEFEQAMSLAIRERKQNFLVKTRIPRRGWY